MKTKYILAALAAVSLSVATTGVLAQGNGGSQGAGSGQRGAGQKMQSDRMIDRDLDRNRDRIDQAEKDQDRSKDRDQDKDRVAQKDPAKDAAGNGQQQRDQSQQQRVYGQELMSVEERNEYQERLRMIDSDEQRGKFVAEHRELMQQRAKAQGVVIEEPESEESE